MANYKYATDLAKQVIQQPFQEYGGEFVAGLTPTQNAAIANVNSAQGMALPYYSQATNNLYAGQQGALGQYNAAGANINNALATGANYNQAATGQYYNALNAATPFNQQASNAYGSGLSAAMPFQMNAYNEGAGYNQAATQALGAGLSQGQALTAAGAQAVNPEQFSQQGVQQYINPYQNLVEQGVMSNLAEQQAQDVSSLQGNAIASGAFGGDRAGVARANLARQQELASSGTLSNLKNAAYAQGLGAFQQQQGVNLGAQQANRAAAMQAGQALYGMGSGAAGQLAGIGQQGYAQGMGLGQNLYNQYMGTGQAMQNLGQNLYAQNTGLAQGLSGLGQQAYAQGIGGAQAQAGLGQNIYNMGSDVAKNLASFGTGAQSSVLQGAQAQLAVGAQQQATKQAYDQAMYNQFLQQQAYPYQATQYFANIAEGIGAGSGGTSSTTAPGTSGGAQFLGGLLSLASLFNRGGAVDNGHDRTAKAGGGAASMGGLVSPAMERQNFAFGGFGMIPYADMETSAGYMPMKGIPIGRQRGLPNPPQPASTQSGFDFAKQLQNAMSPGAKKMVKDKVGGALGIDKPVDVTKLTPDSPSVALPSNIGDFTNPSAADPTNPIYAQDTGFSLGNLNPLNWFADGGAVHRKHFDIGGLADRGYDNGPVVVDDQGNVVMSGVVPTKDTGGGGGGGDEGPRRTLSGYKEASTVASGNDVYSKLHPEFGPKFQQFIEQANKEGIPIKPGSMYRTPDEQARILADKEAGRRGPIQGLPVASPYASGHNYGLAADFSGANPSQYGRLGQIAEGLGLTYGGKFGDPIHVQYGPNDFASLRSLAYDKNGNFNPNFQLPSDWATRSTDSATAPRPPGLVGSNQSYAASRSQNDGGGGGDETSQRTGLGRIFGNIFAGQGNPSLIERVTGQQLSDQTRQAILAAGLGMLSSRSPNFGVAVGEGGMAGLASYYNQMANERAYEKQQQELGMQERKTRVEEQGVSIRERDNDLKMLEYLRQRMRGMLTVPGGKIDPDTQAQYDALIRKLGVAPTPQDVMINKSQAPTGVAPTAPDSGGLNVQPNQNAAPKTGVVPPAAPGGLVPSQPAEAQPAQPAQPPAQQKAQAEATSVNPPKANAASKFVLPPDVDPDMLDAQARLAAAQGDGDTAKILSDRASANRRSISEHGGIMINNEFVPLPGFKENKIAIEMAQDTAKKLQESTAAGLLVRDPNNPQAMPKLIPWAEVIQQDQKSAQSGQKSPTDVPDKIPTDLRMLSQAGTSVASKETDESLKSARTGYEASQNVKLQAAQMRDAASNIPQTGFMAQGPGAEQNIALIGQGNQILRQLGVGEDNLINPKAVGAAEEMRKLTNRMGFDLAKSLGGREPGFIVQQAVGSVPGVENSPVGFQRLMAAIETTAQRQDEYYNAMQQWTAKSGGSIFGFDTWFNQTHPTEKYVAQAILKTIPPTAIDYLRNNPDKADQFNKKYGNDNFDVSSLVLGRKNAGQ